ncbi:MAG: hypothetical protein J7L45_02010 [Candidatus Aenigmarchaeota archaeon]|nr:hypothetical protein [Candidatus Aenigmarchaeota archaeon]
MKIEKKLHVNKIEIFGNGNPHYTIDTFCGKYHSMFMLDENAMIRHGIQIDRKTVGKHIILSLESEEIDPEEYEFFSPYKVGEDEVLIEEISKVETISRLNLYPSITAQYNVEYYSRFSSPRKVGRLPFYEIEIPLTQKEYMEMKNLSTNTLMKVHLSQR